MCIGKKPKAPKPIKPPPPPPMPQAQKTIQEEVQAEGTDRRRNNRRGMGGPAKPTESMLTGNQGVDQSKVNKQLGGVSLLGGK